MTRHILGISAFYHDSAAAILKDGEIVAAAQEERFSRKKHDPRFPLHAINYCLEEAGLNPADLDAIVFYDNPVLTWDRILKNCLTVGEEGIHQFKKAAPSVLGIKIWVADIFKKHFGSLGKMGKILFTEHHFSHAASAFYPSPFSRAAILTIDGVGEWTTTAIGMGEENRINLYKEIHYPHSLGLLYSAFTSFCGFKVNSGEYKLMGLAPYGEPKYYDTIKSRLIDIKEDGSFRLNTQYFGFLDSEMMTNDAFANLFGGPARTKETQISKREMDLAASIQKITEEVVLKLAGEAKKITQCDHLVMAGGVALNCVANGKISASNLFKKIWIQPAAGDAGGALGSALLAHYELFQEKRLVSPEKEAQRGTLLGPRYSSTEIQAYLERHQLPYEKVENGTERSKIIAEALAKGQVVGFVSGRMEFGPRALGARSILGDARNPETQSVMNLKIKFRESFRPFAPAVLKEKFHEYFELKEESPYMLLVAPVNKARRKPMSPPSSANGNEYILGILNQPRSDVPAITHVDYSARIQTVNTNTHPEFYQVIHAFYELTGCPLLVNTSFNVRGEPVVCSPQDAYRCFMRTGMDLLVLENFLLWKKKQPEFSEKENWKESYELD
ncbi:MAG: hypothetical protein A3H42_04505 [Deltaproteobacteria bacterium RIFCSPLOWO2_02_FULL_46_8]|nr:MAG: hypothetical protein A3H42_04505 [Deltaproteobacteria bacterium RIFCSPLOWO2_02_FULL_46_8]